ncbi:MAG: serine protease [Methanothrix sp.]|nr:serine protease [Methanothrix sp.]
MSLVVLEKEIFAVSMVKFFKEGHTYEEECASGFFYEHSGNHYFITNRHVVCDANNSPEQLRLRLHVDKNDLTKNRTFSLSLYDKDEPKWLEHPRFGKDVDIVALPIDKEEISKYYIQSFNIHDLNTNRYLELGEELLVVGYPEGVHDNLHNAPIARGATIATLYNQPFRGRQGFLIDSRLHNGTSGSPVLTKPTTFIRNINGRAELIHDRIKSFKKYLIGVHSEKFDERYPELDLSFVWFASLIPEIIERE